MDNLGLKNIFLDINYFSNDEIGREHVWTQVTMAK
jgi:hypothetical protein